jgi:hypothetical protein
MSLINKRKLFRKLVGIADEIDIWVQRTFKLRPKQATLEAIQDRTTRKNFDDTIGTALGIKVYNDKSKYTKWYLEKSEWHTKDHKK